LPGAVTLLDGAPDEAVAEIAIEVHARKVGVTLPSVTVAAGDCATGKIVVVFEDWQRRAAVEKVVAASGWVVIETVHSFQHAPPIILTAAAACRLEIHFFPGILSDIADKEVPGQSIERAAPGISQPVGPDFRQGWRMPDEGVVRWHSVVAIRITWEIVAVNVHPQNFAEPRREILAVPLWISAATAIAYGNIKIAIRTEGDGSAVMVLAVNLRLLQDCVGRVRIRYIGITGGNLVTGNHDVVIVVGVIDIEVSVRRVIGMERQTQQSLFWILSDQVRNIQKRRGKQRPVYDDPDLAGLLRDEYSAAAVACVGDGGWLGNPANYLLQMNGGKSASMIRLSEPGRCPMRFASSS